jgi:hypothetical protein
MPIKIYGASDDIIEVEGDIEEEFYVHAGDEDEPAFLAFSDGTLLSVHYGHEGIWRLGLVKEGTAEFSKEEGTDSEDYSDIVTLDGHITWVALATDVAK